MKPSKESLERARKWLIKQRLAEAYHINSLAAEFDAIRLAGRRDALAAIADIMQWKFWRAGYAAAIRALDPATIDAEAEQKAQSEAQQSSS